MAGKDGRVRIAEEEAVRLEILYEQAETEILRELARAADRGNQLDYLKSLLDNVQAILKDLRAGARQWTEEAIPHLYQAGVEAANNQLRQLGLDAKMGYGAIHQQAVQLLANAAFERLDGSSATIGRRVEDWYRTAALEATRASIIGYKTTRQVAKDFQRRLAEHGITGFKDAAGRDWNMKSYASMVARTTTMEAHLGGTANRLLESGHDLVIVSDHVEECDLCRPWEGKVLSLTGATPGYPTLAEAKEAGLFHPNCEHTYGLYLDLDAEIKRLEKVVAGEPAPAPTGRLPIKLEFPAGVGAQVDPELIRYKYSPDTIIQTISQAAWPDSRTLREEWEKHKDNWEDDLDWVLSRDDFDALQDAVLADPNSGIYYYVYKGQRPHLAVFVRRLRFQGKVYRNVGLMYDLARGTRAGFYRIDKGERYFRKQPEFVEIRRAGR